MLRHPDARERKIGKSVEGRDLLLWTIGKPDAKVTVWLMFRQHAWESGSSWAGDGAVQALLRDSNLRAGVRWQILPMADPDGVAGGRVRFNHNGYDLNRNWDVDDARLMPEIAAQRSAIQEWRRAGNSIDLFFTLHNTETAEYLEGPPGALGEALFNALKEQTTFDPTRRSIGGGAESGTGKGERGAGTRGRRDSGVPDGAEDRVQREVGTLTGSWRPHPLRRRTGGGDSQGGDESPLKAAFSMPAAGPGRPRVPAAVS